MTGTDYKKALDLAVRELEELLEDQERIATRILSLRKTVIALSTLCEESGEKTNWRDEASPQLLDTLEGSTITEDILQVVNMNPMTLLTTTAIKEQLDLIGTLDKHKNPLATINAVLARLREQDKVEEVISGTKKLWRKKLPPRTVKQLPTPVKPLQATGNRHIPSKPQDDPIEDTLKDVTKGKK
jgi:hypothetical protein